MDEVRPVVTLAALYGAGGSVIGPRVAERLGVTFLDRQILSNAADRSGLPPEAVADADDSPAAPQRRILAALGRASTVSNAGSASREDLDLHERRGRKAIEETIAAAASSGAVILGRGGMIVLRDLPAALHVWLRGSREARLQQGMRLEGIDQSTAERHLATEDRGRRGYVRDVYGVTGDDAALYHLVVDSTALDHDVCVEVIVSAAQARLDATRREQD